jgi:hypothetical protein
MSVAWAAVLISSVTVVLNFFGVMWAGHLQRRMASLERIGDHRIETYVELLKWQEAAADEVGRGDRKVGEQIMGWWGRLQLPEDIRLNVLAYGSDRVAWLTREFQDAAWQARDAADRNDYEERYSAALNEARSRGATAEQSEAAAMQAVKDLAPEWDRAREANQNLRDAVRSELTGTPRTTRLRLTWRARHRPQPY